MKKVGFLSAKVYLAIAICTFGFVLAPQNSYAIMYRVVETTVCSGGFCCVYIDDPMGVWLGLNEPLDVYCYEVVAGPVC